MARGKWDRRPETGQPEGGPEAAPEAARKPVRAEAAPPLDRLDPEQLAGFLELALVPDELLRLCRQIGVTARGYRLESLGSPDHAGLLADEYTEEPHARPAVEAAVARELKSPALRSLWLTGAAARELAQLPAGDPVTALARLAWRFIGDGDPAVRAGAARAIDAGIALLDQMADDAAGPAPEEGGGPGEGAVPADGDSAPVPPPAETEPPVPAAEAAELRKRLARAERDRESNKALLTQARTEIAERDRRVAELKSALAGERVESARQASEISRLSALRSTDDRHLGHELRRLTAEKSRGDERIAAMAEELEAERRRGAELARELARRPERTGSEAHSEGNGAAGEDADARDFVMPRFTDEFYRSLEGWDRRIVKSAFEKALLLARDRRHPSLRALPLEGIENYFRIRVATDVRLIYRRAGDGALELLSLIDREDLDRYVRQAKTRREG